MALTLLLFLLIQFLASLSIPQRKPKAAYVKTNDIHQSNKKQTF